MEDFLKLDDLLTEEEKLTRQMVRAMVDEQVIPRISDAFDKAEFPMEFISHCAKLGLLGLTLSKEWGGANASQVAYGLMCQELERGDSGLRSFVSVQNALSMYPIERFGSDAQKQKYLPSMVKGEMIGCFGLTEPDIGSDPAHLKTRAKKVEGGYLLQGAKRWVTNGTIAHIAIIWAKTEDDKIRGFIVEKNPNPKGLITNEIKHKLSLRASISGEFVFDNCFVPEENLLPGTEIGLGAALACLTKARYGIAWGAIGAAMACYETALRYTKERIQFGKPIAQFQLVQHDLVEMFNEIVKAQVLNLQIGRLHDKNQHTFVMVSLAKMNACKEALKIARMARNLLGANGIILDYTVIRHMANLESVFTYEGTNNMHHLIVGKYLTGLDAFV
jgi:glutaryl-CoA dehydrogenase